ncbi:KEOPS complex kinase/ATPase Bud32 [Candidatus Nanohalococcus occultus]|uniref:KEOPS complex kinase/ATPase Bud32 n=1 Tax=Candidatus Nanohalococcus occultus TaxID=2978047 RepID=UPI0039E0FDC7
MKLQGAEAVVNIGEEVSKERVSKKYRHPDLDDRIREQRNSREAQSLRQAARAGANVPQVLEEKERSLRMEKINGNALKEQLSASNVEKVGKNLAKIHEADIIHGDLTTSNVIVSDEVYLIDFGLSFRSERIEDRAMDLHMFKQILESSHTEKAENCWEAFIDGYSGYEKSEEVFDRLEDVEMRGRYKT